MEGEATWPTQPFPVKPAPFARQTLTEDEITQELDPENKKLVNVFKTLTSGGQYTPIDTIGTVIFPGLDGGAEWGGAATTPEGILYVNSNEMPWLARLNKIEKETEANAPKTGAEVYAKNCAACHGADRSGGLQKTFPDLLQVTQTYSEKDVNNLVRQGKGFMPAFKTLPETQLLALIEFLWGRDDNVKILAEKQLPATEMKEDLTMSPAHKVPYKFEGYRRFSDKNGNSSVKQPWGTLNAIDMNTGEYLWKVTLGHLPEFATDKNTPTGSENYGGPLVTAGGILFIAATRDQKFRAFDKDTGQLLWETQLPFGGYATPATYSVNGKQYVVIAAGGGKMNTPSGDAYVVFALP
jgi:quinoprotein glucose dehydrogenase